MKTRRQKIHGGTKGPHRQQGRWWRGLLCCLCLFVCGLFGSTAMAQAAPEDPVVSVEGVKVEILWSDSSLVRIGRDASITVRVTSTGAELAGTARVTIPISGGGYYVLEETLSVAAGESGQAVLCVPVTYDTGTVTVEFVGDDGRRYASREVNLRASYGEQEIYVAVISSDVGHLAAFDRVMLNEYRGTTTRLFDFKEDTLPVDGDVLKVYDIFLWDDVSRDHISQEQWEALSSWVYEGGVLIIGSESRWREDLEPDEILREGWGRGQYIYCGFSLKDTALLYTGEDGIRDFLYDTVGETRLTSIEENINDAYGEYWSAGNMTAGVDADKIPQVWQYGVVLAVYLILLGPVLYYILKKKKRRNMLRGAMVGLALMFTALIYIMGGRTRFYRPFVNYASIQEIRSGLLMETVYANVSSPSSGEYVLEINKGYEVSPLISYGDVYGSGQRGDTCRLRVCQSPDSTQVWIREGIPFTEELLCLTGTGSSPYGDGFEGQITLFRDGFEGVLRNETDQDFEQVSILSGGRVAVIGDMDAGAEVDLSQIETQLLYGQDQTQLLKEMTGAHLYENAGESEEASRAVWRCRVLENYFSNGLLAEQEEALIIAFPKEEDVSYLNNEDVDLQGTTLVTEAIPLQRQKNGQWYGTMDSNSIQVLQGSYHATRNSTTEALCVLQYDLGEGQVEELIVQWPGTPEDSEYMRAFDRELEFYNWETRTYDAMGKKQIYEGTELQPYLDDQNCLTVRYAMTEMESYYCEVFLPDLAVVGRTVQ